MELGEGVLTGVEAGAAAAAEALGEALGVSLAKALALVSVEPALAGGASDEEADALVSAPAAGDLAASPPRKSVTYQPEPLS